MPVDGTDVTAALLGTAKEMPERFLYWEVPKGDSKPLRQAVRWKNWKSVRHGSDVAAHHPDITK